MYMQIYVINPSIGLDEKLKKKYNSITQTTQTFSVCVNQDVFI